MSERHPADDIETIERTRQLWETDRKDAIRQTLAYFLHTTAQASDDVVERWAKARTYDDFLMAFTLSMMPPLTEQQVGVILDG
jgi:hypothetical protein